MKRWHWIVIMLAFALADALAWFKFRAPTISDEQRAAKVGIRYLTHDADAVDYWPIFSPDGKTVLFSRQMFGDRAWHFFVVPTQGGAAAPFMRGADDISATRANWSGKANLIAFTKVLSGRASETWLVRGDGHKRRR